MVERTEKKKKEKDAQLETPLVIWSKLESKEY